MKYHTRPATVEAFHFTGTIDSIEDAILWVADHDIENAEVSWQGDRMTGKPLTLDVTNAYGLTTLEAGDYLVIHEGKLRAYKADDFHATYADATYADADATYAEGE